MAAVRHLGFVKFDFLMAGAVKGHILHQRTKFYKDRSKKIANFRHRGNKGLTEPNLTSVV